MNHEGRKKESNARRKPKGEPVYGHPAGESIALAHGRPAKEIKLAIRETLIKQ
jgi:hypothetical protein